MICTRTWHCTVWQASTYEILLPFPPLLDHEPMGKLLCLGHVEQLLSCLGHLDLLPCLGHVDLLPCLGHVDLLHGRQGHVAMHLVPKKQVPILQAPPGQMPIHLTSLGQDLDLGQGCCPLHGLENVCILLLGREHLCILLLGQVHMCILPLVLGHVYILLLVPRHVYIILQVLGHVKCLLRHLLYQLGS